MGGYEWLDGAWRDDPTKKRNPAARVQADRYKDLVRISKSGEARWTGRFAFDAEKLSEPLRRKTPTLYFVNSMSDLFGEGLTNEQIAAVFGVMAMCSQHTFQILTKRIDRAQEWYRWAHETDAGAVATCLSWAASHGVNTTNQSVPWPLPNVWLGVSAERQREYDERTVMLAEIPAAVRWVSVEPMLESIDLNATGALDGGSMDPATGQFDCLCIGWVVLGGESGVGARPCAVEWIRGGVDQCHAWGVPVFVKQLGAHYVDAENGIGGYLASPSPEYVGLTRRLKDKKGADPSEWPADLAVREWPHGFTPPSPERRQRTLPFAPEARRWTF
jgi:protein gp37